MAPTFLACPSCACHVRASDSVCPLCAAPMTRAGNVPRTSAAVAMGLAVIALAATGCGDDTGGGSGGGGGGGTGGAAATSSVSGSQAASGGGEGGDGSTSSVSASSSTGEGGDISADYGVGPTSSGGNGGS